MQPYQANMRQAATYWPPGDNDGFGGLTFGAPQAIKCRWEDQAKLFRDPQGNEVMSVSIVYPNQRLEVKGYLLLGSSATADPRTVPGAREIRQNGQSPSLTQDRVLYKVWL